MAKVFISAGHLVENRDLAENIKIEVKKIDQNSMGYKTRLNSIDRDYCVFIRDKKGKA